MGNSSEEIVMEAKKQVRNLFLILIGDWKHIFLFLQQKC
jgi:hypothetical protein